MVAEGGTKSLSIASGGALAQVTRAYRTLSAGNRTLLRASDEQELLEEMCRVVVEQGGYRIACVGYAEHDTAKSLRWVAFAGFEPALKNLTWADTPEGNTAAGTAIRTGQPVVGRNLRTNPAYAPWRESGIKLLLSLGCEASSAFPLRVDGEVIGTLAITAAEPDAFDTEEVRLLTELADDLAYGITNLRIRVKQRETQALIERIAFWDPLTGLPNRAALRDQLAAALDKAARLRRPVALLHIELARYQEISDTLGYHAADQLLQMVAACLTQFAPGGQGLARVGEADFAVLLQESGAQQAVQLAKSLLGALNTPLELAGLMVAPRGGIGIALFPGHGTEPDILIHRAKVAAYEARRCTTAGYMIYMGTVDQECTRQLALMGDLRRAIEHNELLLYCQPKVEICTGKACGAEALVRWQHPQHGMLATGDFIKLAEHTGLITPLTHWVLDAACSQSYAWHGEGLDWPISVNLSAHDLRDPNLLDSVRGTFATWGISPERIQFELTESALMADPVGAREVLGRLKDLGVDLSVDDFGTGYSSLAYLQQLPVDSIKIDQSFVGKILTNKDSATIVRSTIELGHNLDLHVVAEGVDSEGIWEHLASLGCDTAQGYFISTPIPSDQFRNWEEHWRASGHH